MLVSRRATVAAALGFVLATAATVGVFAWAGSGEPPVDGEFVLDEPGEFQEPVVTSPVRGEVVPDVELFDASGAVRRLSEFRGTPMVVNVWYSTCAPCAREVRDFAEVHREVGDRIQFVGVNPLDTAERMTQFAADRDVDYLLLARRARVRERGPGERLSDDPLRRRRRRHRRTDHHLERRRAPRDHHPPVRWLTPT